MSRYSIPQLVSLKLMAGQWSTEIERAPTEMRKSIIIAIGIAWGISVFFVAAIIADLFQITVLARPNIAYWIIFVSLILVILYYNNRKRGDT